MRVFILPTGTSVVHGLQQQQIALQPGHEKAALSRQALLALGQNLTRLSAELSALSLMAATEDDTVALLATDTPQGAQAAELVAHIIETTFDLPVTVHTIDGLVLDDIRRFRTVGLPTLIRTLDRIVGSARRDGDEPIVGVGSGIKAVVPYLAVYAMLRKVTLAYAFDQPAAMLSLPRLPIAFDLDAIRAAGPVLRRISTESSLPRSIVAAELGDYFATLEGLFEAAGADQITLSPFGFLVEDDLKVAEETQILLSPSARRSLANASALARSQFEFMLSRVANPLWRSAKHHTFAGTDLSVWKPGNTPERMAGWVATPNLVCVAELYDDHEIYERTLGARRKRDYDVGSFEPWQASQPYQDVLTPEEVSAGRLRAEADRQEAELRAELAEAVRATEQARVEATGLLNEAADLERALAAARTSVASAESTVMKVVAEADELRTAKAVLDRELAGMRGRSLAGRLRWAFSGR